MPKKNNIPFDLEKFTQQVNKIAAAQGTEFDYLKKEFNSLSNKNDKISRILAGSWNQRVSNPEVEEELNKLMPEVSLEEKEKELSGQVDQKLQDRLDKLRDKVPTAEGEIPTVPTMEEIVSTKQTRRLSAEGFSFNDNKDLTIVDLDAQVTIAETFSEISTNHEEKKEFDKVTTKLGMLKQAMHDMPEVPKEDQPKIFEIIGKGLEKIYDGIKEGVSSALDGIKKLGGKFVESIKSIFKGSPEKQLEKKRDNLKGLYENFVELKDATGKVKEESLKRHFNEIDKLTTPQEFLEETAKITKNIQRAGKDKLLDINKKRIESQKALQQKYPQHNNGLSPSPTPPVTKGPLNGRQH